MSKRNGFFTFMLGGLLGATVALLYAPHSGEETREILNANAEEIKERALQSIQEAQDTAVSSIQQAQVRINEVNEEMNKRLNNLQETSQQIFDEQDQRA